MKNFFKVPTQLPRAFLQPLHNINQLMNKPGLKTRCVVGRDLKIGVLLALKVQQMEAQSTELRVSSSEIFI